MDINKIIRYIEESSKKSKDIEMEISEDNYDLFCRYKAKNDISVKVDVLCKRNINEEWKCKTWFIRHKQGKLVEEESEEIAYKDARMLCKYIVDTFYNIKESLGKLKRKYERESYDILREIPPHHEQELYFEKGAIKFLDFDNHKLFFIIRTKNIKK